MVSQAVKTERQTDREREREKKEQFIYSSPLLSSANSSRVGHIFRSFHPYSFPGNKDTHGINTARTVEVWMDEYKRLFYMNRPDLLSTDIGDVSK